MRFLSLLEVKGSTEDKLGLILTLRNQSSFYSVALRDSTIKEKPQKTYVQASDGV